MAAAQPKTPQTPLLFGLSMGDMNNTLTVNVPKQAASSLPNSPSVLSQMGNRHNENGYLNIPSIITSREEGNNGTNSMNNHTLNNGGLASSISDTYTLLGNEVGKHQIHQAISAPVTPTNSVFAPPPRRIFKGNGVSNGNGNNTNNNNNNNNDGKTTGPKSKYSIRVY
jgi:hypothetical protein